MSALAVSQIEKHFITNQIYKRSRRYFDVIKLKSIQNQNQKFRRKPIQQQSQQIEKKIQANFMSSQDFYNRRRQAEIQKSSKKNTFQSYDDKGQTQTNYTVATKNFSSTHKKAFDMGKSLPRQFYQNLQSHSYTSIEDPFDNFVQSDFSKGQKGKSIDFNKILGRRDKKHASIELTKKKDILNPEENRSSYLTQMDTSKLQNLNKSYEKFFYDESRFKCLIDVEKQRKAEHRKNLRTSLKQINQKPKQIDLQKIEKGRRFSIKKPTPTGLMFYYGKGKQEMSQMHLKTLKSNQNYWIEQLKIMKKQDFQTVKRRQEMIERRKAETYAKKCVVDVRGQICDAKFFLRLKKPQN